MCTGKNAFLSEKEKTGPFSFLCSVYNARNELDYSISSSISGVSLMKFVPFFLEFVNNC